MKAKIENILKQVAESEQIKNYEVVPHTDALRGEGFMGEFYTGKVRNKDTGLTIQVYIKVPPVAFGEVTPAAFYNECHFYSTIFPELQKFQTEKGVKRVFSNVPKFYCGHHESTDSYVVMENLKVQKYVLHDKSKHINKDLLKAIFGIYGKFHALSFAFKDQNLEKYLKMTTIIKDIFAADNDRVFLNGSKRAFIQAYKSMQETDTEIAKKLKPYAENFEDIYDHAMRYKGKYSAFTHGDCWSNNVLIKYAENGKIEDIKLIDFQLCRDSTPIHDLSYFFYSGASKEDFDHLDEYLELYYNSFSTFAKELGSNPEKVFSFNTLKSEWKTNSLFGILLGLMLWQIKLLQRESIEIFSISDNREDLSNGIFHVWQSEAFKKNTSDILRHAVNYGIL